jgi:hypothetical protein
MGIWIARFQAVTCGSCYARFPPKAEFKLKRFPAITLLLRRLGQIGSVIADEIDLLDPLAAAGDLLR